VNFTYLIKKNCRQYPGKIALIENDKHVTYREFWEKTGFVSRLYRDMGVKSGDRIVIVLPNSIDFLIYYFAAMKMGAVAVPVKTEYRSVEFSTILQNSRPALFISYRHWYDENPAVLKELEPGTARLCVEDINPGRDEHNGGIRTVRNSDPATINYSCFGDGYLKGAVLTHGNHIYSATGYVKHLEFIRDDRFLVILPMPHIFTISGCINSSLIKGGTMIFTGRLTPKSILADIRKYHITVLTAVPVVYEYLAKYKRKDRYDLSSLRRSVTGGDLMPENLQKVFEKTLNIQILQGYGLTEALPIICNPPGQRNKPGTLGVPGRKDIIMKIVNENGEEVPVNQVGELLMKSPTTMCEYYKLPVDTENILTNGWLRTGDYGKIDADGFLYFCGLKKKIFNIYGNKIDPLEVEHVLCQHPLIEKAKIYLHISDKESPLSNKRICGDIYVKNGRKLANSEIVDFCSPKIAAYKIPKRMNIYNL
jgi:long-chain acyl-CoA synthetase